MATRILSRYLSVLILGVAFGVVAFFSDLRDAHLGRAKFLDAAEVRFDDIETNIGALLPLSIVGILVALAVFGIYELVAYGIYKVLDRFDRKADCETTSS